VTYPLGEFSFFLSFFFFRFPFFFLFFQCEQLRSKDWFLSLASSRPRTQQPSLASGPVETSVPALHARARARAFICKKKKKVCVSRIRPDRASRAAAALPPFFLAPVGGGRRKVPPRTYMHLNVWVIIMHGYCFIFFFPALLHY